MTLPFKMSLSALTLAATLICAPLAQARDGVAALSEALLLPDVVALLREEGLRYGNSLDDDVLSSTGGRYFAEQIARIYNTDTMIKVLEDMLSAGMTEDEIAESVAFFATDSGQRILRLEVSARKAMGDPAIDEIAEDAWRSAEADADARFKTVLEFIEINDLNERNVAGALSSNYHFFRGLVEGGSHKMSEDEMLSEVWAQEEDIRSETSTWLKSFLFMAYSPLSDEEMAAYLAYSDSGAGQALNAALFDGFDEMYRTIYFALGLAVAEGLQASEL
ncbi:MAG: DUF2059 domain-containing protein [Arenibacterium sp.]